MNEQQHVASGSIIRGPRPDSSKQPDVVYAVKVQMQVQVEVWSETCIHFQPVSTCSMQVISCESKHRQVSTFAIM